MMYITEDKLAHYGILGMKWGVRKSRKDSDSSAKRERLSKNQRGDKKASIMNSKILAAASAVCATDLTSRSVVRMIEKGKIEVSDILQVIGGVAITSDSIRRLID